jgi:hypothetical protein
MKRILLLIALFPALAHGQLTWRPSSIHNEGLPPGIRVYETTDSLDGRPFRAFYLEADLKDPALDFTVLTGNGKRYTPAQYDSLENGQTLAVINTTFFSFKDNSNLNIVIHKGKVLATNPKLAKYTTRGAFGIDRRRNADIAWVYNVGKKNKPYAYDVPVTPEINGTDTVYREPGKRYPKGAHKWKMREAVGGGPVLVQNGQPFVTSAEERMLNNHDLHPRSAVGYTAGGKLILLAIEGRNKGMAEGATFPQMAKMFTDLQCVEALNLDGGGSSALYVQRKNTITPSDKGGQRAVPAVLVIRRK